MQSGDLELGHEHLSPRPDGCACDCRRTPKIILSIVSLALFGCAFIVPILDIPLYSVDSPLAGQSGFFPFYNVAEAPEPNAYAHVYLARIRACFNNNNTQMMHVVARNNGTTCSPYKDLLFSMSNKTLSFQIGDYKVVPGPNAEYFANPAIMITGTLAVMVVGPLLFIVTLFYFISLIGLRRHFATAGAVLGFAVLCLGTPVVFYGFSVDNLTSIDLVAQVGIEQPSIIAGILMLTAIAIQTVLIWSTCICCCCCTPKAKQGWAVATPLNADNDSVRYDPNAKSAGVKCREAFFNIILWFLCTCLWVCLFAFPYCSYIPQCPSQYMPNQDNCGPDQTVSCTPSQCQSTICQIFADYLWLKMWGPMWAVQVIVAFFSPAARALRNSCNRRGTKAYVNAIKSQPPYLWFHIQCYHIDVTITTTTDRYGYTLTTRSERRVNTHSASGSFKYKGWFDATPALIIPGSLSFHLVGAPTRIHATKDYSFANTASQNEYNRQFTDFINIHDRDTLKDVSSGLNINGFEEYALAYQQNNDIDIPTRFHYGWHFLSSIFALSPLYEFIFYAESMSTHLYVRKVVSV